jgi:two-component system, chemotaxis family, CheB/CheR fusion protein
MTDSNSRKAPLIPVCGIGASAGGLEALQMFFNALPNDLGLAYVIIVHLAPDRKSDLPSIIQRWTSMPVIQVGDHDKVPLESDHVYVIAPDRKLEITDTSVGASQFEQARGQRAAIDLFFRSLASSRGDGFAVVLSGSGSDGALGSRAVKEAGGLVLVQDPGEAAHGDMPRAVIDTGVADLVLPVRELVERLAELARSKERFTELVHAAENSYPTDRDQERAVRGIFDLLLRRTGHDFSRYKRNTILRRLARRMQLCHQATISDYLQYVRTNVGEVKGLFDDLLISVTSFFRDPDAWEALQMQVIGPIVEKTEPGEQIRVWVPACATGEEAYTIAILFHEELERHGTGANLVVFASDPDEGSLATARAGLYPKAISADVSESRLERYFQPEGDHYRVVNTVRDNLVFAVHNLLRDPPFSRQNLISCRNLLIYLDRDLQEQAMSVFRYACREHAYLFLGASEMADEALFAALDKKSRIFATRELGEGIRPPVPELSAAPSMRAVTSQQPFTSLARATGMETHLSAIEELAPPSLTVDERWNVLHLSSTVARYLQQSGGPLAQRITDLVRPELRDELHALLHRALELPEAQSSPFVSVTFDGSSHRVAMTAQQRSAKPGIQRHVLITFLDGGESGDEPASEQLPTNELVRSLREKLRHAEQRIESMRDDSYLANQELRSANEELQSLNEEYRSTTEELETSKEELQSTNEELQTVNNELKIKLEEVSRANSDLENLMVATDVATLFLDADCRISRYTPQLMQIFNVKARDQERPISDLTHNLDYPTLETDARKVLATGEHIEREVQDHDGHVYMTRLRPYRTTASDISGVVITFIDMTPIKRAETALRESERRLEEELKVMRVLHSTAVALTSGATMQGALEEFLEAALVLTGSDFAAIWLLDTDSRRLKIFASQGFGADFLEILDMFGAAEDSPCGHVMRTWETCFVDDIAQDPRFAVYWKAVSRAGYRAVQAEPLITQDGEFVGVLSVYFRERRSFSDRNRQLGGLVARLASDLIIGRIQQDRLGRLNETLRQRTLELEAIRDQLSLRATDLLEQDRNRETFLAALGHELRNPMAAINNSIEVLSVTDDKSLRAMSILKRQVAKMVRLINDMLDLTRVNRGTLRLDLGKVDLAECIVDAVQAVRRQAQTKGLVLHIEMPRESIAIEADAERMGQILDNLLHNAVNFTDSGSITVTVRKLATEALVAIRDTGIGVDPGRIASLFDGSKNGSDRSAGGGLGLGLSLVGHLVELHHGSVSLRSEGRGLGSEVTLMLPLVTSAETPNEAPTDIQLPSRRILVVDNNSDVADALGIFLEKIGQQTVVAYSGETAIEAAREQRPQVAFIDLTMPGMDGIETATRLRELFSSEDLKLIALSGHASSYLAGEQALFERYLMKPAGSDDIIALLRSL